MSDYQAIYDAVRSRIHNGDVGQAIENAVRAAGIDFAARMAGAAIQTAVSEYERPSVLFRPKLYMEGAQWCALYGDDLQNGVAGFGDSPSAAMHDFDDQWVKK